MIKVQIYDIPAYLQIKQQVSPATHAFICSINFEIQQNTCSFATVLF